MATLGEAERHLRSQIAISTRYGRPTRTLRLQFDETKATTELNNAAKRLLAARKAQGLPSKVTDTATLRNIAVLLGARRP